MTRASNVTLLLVLATLGCTQEPMTTAPMEPLLASAAFDGNPPPPPVFGIFGGPFRLSDAPVSVAQQLNFRVTGIYNRNLTTGAHLMEIGSASLRADASGVVRAQGIITATDASGATLTINLAQLVGFTGPIILPCPPGGPINCFILNSALFGTVRFPNGLTVPASGSFRFRWELP